MTGRRQASHDRHQSDVADRNQHGDAEDDDECASRCEQRERADIESKREIARTDRPQLGLADPLRGRNAEEGGPRNRRQDEEHADQHENEREPEHDPGSELAQRESIPSHFRDVTHRRLWGATSLAESVASA